MVEPPKPIEQPKPPEPPKIQPPKPTGPVGVALPVHITSIEGQVQYRMTPDDPWVWLKKDMDLPDTAELRTGVRSTVNLLILPDKPATLQSLKTLQIRDAVEGKSIPGLKYLPVKPAPGSMLPADGPRYAWASMDTLLTQIGVARQVSDQTFFVADDDLLTDEPAKPKTGAAPAAKPAAPAAKPAAPAAKGDDDLLGDEPAKTKTAAPAAAVKPVEKLPPAQMVAAGGWYRDDSGFALKYRPVGHADPLLHAWLDLAASAPKAASLFKNLADPKSVGLCAKCHSADSIPDSAALLMNWRPRHREIEDRSFTKFNHAPHVIQGNLRNCTGCHEPNKSADVMPFFVGNDPAKFVSNFKSIDKATCAGCHKPDAAGDSCLRCHNYHVGSSSKIVASLPQDSAPAAPDQ